MAQYTFPASVLDRPRNLLAVLGSFWTRTFREQNQLTTYARAAALQHEQLYLDLVEAAACVSRVKIPVFHRENWYRLTIKQSETNTTEASLARYGDDGLVFAEDDLLYGVPPAGVEYTYLLPETLVRASTIMNRLTEPSVVLHDTTDFVLDVRRRALTFRQNPFDNELLPRRPVYENGEVVDYELDLWVFRGEFDWQYAYEHFGYQLGLQMQSSQGYKDLLNALFDALVLGASDRALEAAFAAMTGVPLVQELTETVEFVAEGCEAVTIVTDRHAYKFHPNAVPVVALGDVVHAGDPLVDALTFYELNRGVTPDDLRALAVGPGFLANCYHGDLVFENKTVSLVVDEEHESGYTYVSFALGGMPADVDKFFDDMHEKGIADAQRATDACDDAGRRRGTLAHLLDKRVNLATETKARHLPTTINPLEFLITNVLRNNAFIVRVKAAAMGRFRLGLYNVRHLRRLLPPHAAMIVVVELDARAERISYLSLSETLSTLTATNPLQDVVPESLTTERSVSLRQISVRCQ